MRIKDKVALNDSAKIGEATGEFLLHLFSANGMWEETIDLAQSW